MTTRLSIASAAAYQSWRGSAGAATYSGTPAGVKRRKKKERGVVGDIETAVA